MMLKAYSMVNLKLVSEEEEEIQVLDVGRLEEIDSYVLSLLGKFLTCNPTIAKKQKTHYRRPGV